MSSEEKKDVKIEDK